MHSFNEYLRNIITQPAFFLRGRATDIQKEHSALLQKRRQSAWDHRARCRILLKIAYHPAGHTDLVEECNMEWSTVSLLFNNSVYNQYVAWSKSRSCMCNVHFFKLTYCDCDIRILLLILASASRKQGSSLTFGAVFLYFFEVPVLAQESLLGAWATSYYFDCKHWVNIVKCRVSEWLA